MIRRRKQGCNITDGDGKYCTRLAVIKSLWTGQYYGYDGWFNIPDPGIKVYKNKDAAKPDYQRLNREGVDVEIEEMQLIPGLRFDH
jgi:hypothetical protein